MHICVVAGTFHPETGGPPTYLYHLLPELINRGHTLEVITYTDDPQPVTNSEEYPYPIYRVSRAQPIVVRLAILTWNVLRVGRRSDVILASEYGLPAALAGKVLRKPVVIKIVGDFAWEFSIRHRWLRSGVSIDEFQVQPSTLRVNFLKGLRSWYVRAASAVIVPSRYIGRLVSRWGVDHGRIRIIYNALALGQFTSLPDQSTARARLGLPDGTRLILTVARMTPWKGLADIIRALSMVQIMIPDTQLLIIGDGPERTNLEKLAHDQKGVTRFIGNQSSDQVHQYMRASDVFVLFSTYEGMPHTVLEAMAVKTPVIASQVGGTVEVIEHDLTGLLVHPGDITGLAAEICRLLSHPHTGSRLTKAAFANLAKFSWDTLVNETEGVLYEVVK